MKKTEENTQVVEKVGFKRFPNHNNISCRDEYLELGKSVRCACNGMKCSCPGNLARDECKCLVQL